MEELLIRSEAFVGHLDALFIGHLLFSEERPQRFTLSTTATTVSLDHAAAVRLTLGAGHPVSAIALIRLQYEALLRGAWLLFVANDGQLEKLASPLSVESQQAAKNMPTVAQTLPLLIASSAPEELKRVMTGFHQAHGHALNSFVHSGIHPLHRSASGFPLALGKDALKQSNILVHTTYRLLAHLAGSADLMKSVTAAVAPYADCLSLERPPHREA